MSPATKLLSGSEAREADCSRSFPIVSFTFLVYAAVVLLSK